MYSSEDMEEIGESIGRDLLKIASPKTILCSIVCVNLTIGALLYYIFN